MSGTVAGRVGPGAPPIPGARVGLRGGATSSAAALYGLLRRPVTVAWLPLTALASLTSLALSAVVLGMIDRSLSRFPFATVWWTYSMLIGLLVGQAIKELQHCHFSWMLPRLRPRLRPAALAVAAVLALFPRELAIVIFALGTAVMSTLTGRGADLLVVWNAFTAPSVGMAAVTFMAFWIGVRPSAVNLIGVMGPLVLLGPFLEPVIVGNLAYGITALVLASTLSAFLIYDTFSAGAARARPFLPTKQLTGGTWATSRKPSAAVKISRFSIGRGSDWRLGQLGNDTYRWLRAGWHENYGHRGRLVLFCAVAVPAIAYAIQAWMVGTTMINSPPLWMSRGYPGLPSSVSSTFDSIIIASMVIAVPMAVFMVVYGSISLRQRWPYPLSRPRRAELESTAGLIEALAVCGFVAALLLGFWLLIDVLDSGRLTGWPRAIGGQNGWVLILMRALVAVFVLTPVAQYVRLRYLRGANPASPVVRLITALTLSASLAWIGAWVALASMTALPRSPLILQALILATLATISHQLYRRAVEHYFRTADLA